MENAVRGNLELAPGSLLRIRDGRELVVHARRGSLWITQEGDPRDRFVAAGSGFRISAAGLTLVSALGSGGAGVELVHATAAL